MPPGDATWIVCPTCGKRVNTSHERRDQRGLAQDLRVVRGHGDGRSCKGSGKRIAPDDPRLRTPLELYRERQ